MSEKQLGVTIKAPESARYAADNPWFVFEGDPQTIGNNIVQTFGLEDVDPSSSLAEIVLLAQTTVTALANAVRGTQPAPAAPAPQAAPVQQQPAGWGNSAPAAAPAWSGAQQGANGGPQNGTPHPEGQVCPADGNVLQYKSIKDGQYKMWVCPQQRSKGDGHAVQWIK